MLKMITFKNLMKGGQNFQPNCHTCEGGQCQVKNEKGQHTGDNTVPTTAL